MNKEPSSRNETRIFLQSLVTWVVPPVVVALLGWLLPLVFSIGHVGTVAGVSALELLTFVATMSLGVASVSLALMVTTHHRLRMAAAERRELEVARAEADRRRRRAESNHRRQGAFLADISQEMRAPIHQLIEMTAPILADSDPDQDQHREQRQFASDVRRECESLLGVIGELVDLSNAESGQVVIDQVQIDLRELVEDVTDSCAVTRDGHQLAVSAIVDRDAPARMIGDPTRIRQVLATLIGNAVRFTPEGEVVVRVAPRQMDGKQALHFDVADTGVGIPETTQSHVLDILAGTEGPARVPGSRGVGLSLARRLVELMGGVIGFKSELGIGSSFWFSIPVDVVDSPVGERRGEAPVAGKHLLCVEPDEAARPRVEAMLAALGSRFDCVGDSAVALELLRSAGRIGDPYDVVLVDWRVMDRSGFNLALSIQSDLITDQTAIVIMLEPGEHVSADELAEWSITATIPRPLTSTRLRAVLATCGAPNQPVRLSLAAA